MSRRQQRAAAAARSYTTPAVITLLLYFLLYVPGVIANIAYIRQSRRDEALLGYEAEGSGCLYALLMLFVAAPAVVLVLLFALGELTSLVARR